VPGTNGTAAVAPGTNGTAGPGIIAPAPAAAAAAGPGIVAPGITATAPARPAPCFRLEGGTISAGSVSGTGLRSSAR